MRVGAGMKHSLLLQCLEEHINGIVMNFLKREREGVFFGCIGVIDRERERETNREVESDKD
jgi:hypothetical protein